MSFPIFLDFLVEEVCGGDDNVEKCCWKMIQEKLIRCHEGF